MISFIKGKNIEISPTKLIVDVNGVGYCLHVSKNTLDNIGAIDQSVILKTDLQSFTKAVALLKDVNLYDKKKEK